MCCWLYEPHSKSSFKFCSNKLDSPCPTTQNSLRLAALPRKNIKKLGVNLELGVANLTTAERVTPSVF